MISIDEVRRIAGVLELEPRVIDHDYVLGCYLCFLGTQSIVQRKWLFKGGTALRKCYFEEYKFISHKFDSSSHFLLFLNIREVIVCINILF